MQAVWRLFAIGHLAPAHVDEMPFAKPLVGVF